MASNSKLVGRKFSDTTSTPAAEKAAPASKPAPVTTEVVKTQACQGLTKTGQPCKNKAVAGGRYCRQHADQEPKGFQVLAVDVPVNLDARSAMEAVDEYLASTLSAAQLEKIQQETAEILERTQKYADLLEERSQLQQITATLQAAVKAAEQAAKTSPLYKSYEAQEQVRRQAALASPYEGQRQDLNAAADAIRKLLDGVLQTARLTAMARVSAKEKAALDRLEVIQANKEVRRILYAQKQAEDAAKPSSGNGSNTSRKPHFGNSGSKSTGPKDSKPGKQKKAFDPMNSSFTQGGNASASAK